MHNIGNTMVNLVSKVDKHRAVFACCECGSHYETRYYDAVKSRIGHLCPKCKTTVGLTLDQNNVRKFFLYDPISGKLTWRLPTFNNYVGEEVTSISKQGYYVVNFNKIPRLVHRIIWLYQTGYLPEQVDHIDHDRTNNKWDNLREVSNTENSKNTSVSKNSSTKINGVSFMKSRNKYRASITVNRKQIHLGLFDDIASAIQARADADIKYNFHTNHGK